MGLDKVSNVSPDTLRKGRLPAVILLLSLAFELTGSAGRSALRFDRQGIENAEVWRLLTGHLVHLGWAHLAMNAAGLLLVWVLVGRNFTLSGWLAIIVASIVGIDAGLWFLDPGLAWYVGLSGVLHGMLAAGIVPEARQGNLEALVLGALMTGKIAWEQFFGPLPGSADIAGGNVVVSAHFYGAVSGLLAGVVLIRVRPRRPI